MVLKANFVVVDIIDNELYVKGDYSSLETTIYFKINRKNELRLTLHIQSIRNLVKNKYFLINKINHIVITTS